jgi:hypothetical protein
MAQVIKHLPTKHKTLHSNSSTNRIKKSPYFLVPHFLQNRRMEEVLLGVLVSMGDRRRWGKVVRV